MHLSTLQQINVPDISHPNKACLEVYVVPRVYMPYLGEKNLRQMQRKVQMSSELYIVPCKKHLLEYMTLKQLVNHAPLAEIMYS